MSFIQTFAVTYALVTISVEAGHPDFGIHIPNQVKRSAIKTAEEMNLNWNKWQIAMFIISSTRLLAKQGELNDRKHNAMTFDLNTMMAFDKIYEAGLKKLDELNLDHDCVVNK